MPSPTPPPSRRARLLQPTAKNLAWVAQALKQDQVGGLPTETVYGLAGSLFSERALRRIYSAKQRPLHDPLIAHFADPVHRKRGCDDRLKRAEELGLIDLSPLSPQTQVKLNRLMRQFWPGALTLILPKNRSQVPDLATSHLPSVALRMPRHAVATALLQRVKIPLAAPSANRFGRISPTCAQDVLSELGSEIPWVLEGGPCRHGIESTILWFDLAVERFRWMRPGALGREAIEAVLQEPLLLRPASPVRQGATPPAQLSPGLLLQHYAPSLPLQLLPAPCARMTALQWQAWQKKAATQLQGLSPSTKICLIVMQEADTVLPPTDPLIASRLVVKSLSQRGKPEEIAAQLFQTLRACDLPQEFAALWVEPCADLEGLKAAIQDRLQRAASQP